MCSLDYFIRKSFRIDQIRIETDIHAMAAAAKPSAADHETSNQTTAPNASRPILPKAAPEASRATAALARFAPRIPRSSFRLRSCFSTSVALAGNIAGKARKRPPMTGPYRLAIAPVSKVAIPPKPNRSGLGRYLRERLKVPSMFDEEEASDNIRQ